MSAKQDTPSTTLAPSHYHNKVTKYIQEIRHRFSGYVIRRTLASVDYAGQPISSLKPFTERYSKFELYDHEKRLMEELKVAIKEEKGSQVFVSF